jgi:adenosylcobinamide-GDP ribazoletransferase
MSPGAAVAALAEIRAATAFLTRLPAAEAGPATVPAAVDRPRASGPALGAERSPVGERTGAAAFGLVGAAVGALGGLLLVPFAPSIPLAAAGLALAAIAVVSGGLHLDGLADTVDAVAAPDPATAEQARKDPRIGSAGAAALVLVLLVEAAALAALVSTAGVMVAAFALIVAGASSRAAVVILAPILVRASDGAGGWFADRVRRLDGIVALGSAVIVTAGLALAEGRPRLVVALLVGWAAAAVVGWLLGRVRGAVDGDGYGAIVEIGVAATLLGAAVAR